MNPGKRGCGIGSRDTAQAGGTGLRGLRTTVFAVVCVLTALAMHVLAGGPVPGFGTVLAATVITGAGAFLLTRRRRSRHTLLAASFTAQYGMHQLFTTAPHAAQDLLATTPPAAASSAPALHAYATDASALVAHHGGGLSASAGMLLAHVVVAVLSAWWLDRGETTLATIIHLLATSLRDLWAALSAWDPAPPAPTRRPALLATAPLGPLTPQALTWTLCRRGPPALTSS
ncbi:hypothetical protein ABZW11_28410 [Nonomuraea sp. NPDC004580]|uniref:hypothetical protein n=1 Tax=Nonomuraea sp. NPDC004580 TaxID=3154552 RepID=UPI0033B6BCCA